MISLLAFLFALLVLAKTALTIFYPDKAFELMEPYFKYINNHRQFTVSITVISVIISGIFLASLTSFNILIATGWFWSFVYTLTIHSAYLNHHESQEHIKKMCKNKEFITNIKFISIIFFILAFLTLAKIVF